MGLFLVVNNGDLPNCEEQLKCSICFPILSMSLIGKKIKGEKTINILHTTPSLGQVL